MGLDEAGCCDDAGRAGSAGDRQHTAGIVPCEVRRVGDRTGARRERNPASGQPGQRGSTPKCRPHPRPRRDGIGLLKNFGGRVVANQPHRIREQVRLRGVERRRSNRKETVRVELGRENRVVKRGAGPSPGGDHTAHGIGAHIEKRAAE